MPKPKPPPPAQPRILKPDDAKRLARNTSPEPSRYRSIPRASAPTPEPTTPGPSLTRKRFLPTLISNLRSRYASLPTPVRGTCRFLRIFGTLVPIGIFFHEHVAGLRWVRGPSMTPYLNEDYDEMHTKKDVVLVSMWPWGRVWPWERQRRLERGMVVTFRSPADPRNVAIKRVIGLPGDRITTREPCMKPTQIVPFNHVWLEGDVEDPRKSLDSNAYGPVSISLISGRVVAVLSPRMRWLNWTDWEEGKLDGDHKSEANYRQNVRDRVLKEAVRLEQPSLE